MFARKASGDGAASFGRGKSMSKRGVNRRYCVRGTAISAAIAAVVTLATLRESSADEGGVSFWLPGFDGSFAAVPMDPGWSLAFVYYHASVEASGSKQFQFGGNIAAKVEARADFGVVSPTYVFSDPVADGQLALSLAGIVGQSEGT